MVALHMCSVDEMRAGMEVRERLARMNRKVFRCLVAHHMRRSCICSTIPKTGSLRSGSRIQMNHRGPTRGPLGSEWDLYHLRSHEVNSI